MTESIIFKLQIIQKQRQSTIQTKCKYIKTQCCTVVKNIPEGAPWRILSLHFIKPILLKVLHIHYE